MSENHFGETGMSHATRFQRVDYHCDINSAHHAVIPLGVVGEISRSDAYGLGLICRKELSEQEIVLIGGMVRPVIRSPYTFIVKTLNEVWKSPDRIAAFAHLTERQTSAVRYSRISGLTVEPYTDDGDQSVEGGYIDRTLTANLRFMYEMAMLTSGMRETINSPRQELIMSSRTSVVEGR